MKNSTVFALVVIVLALVLSACGGPTPGEAISNVGAAGVAALQEAKGYYKDVVNMETGISAVQQNFAATYNAGLNTILDGNKVTDQCFTNTADVVGGALAGVFDQPKETGSATPNGEQTVTGVLNQDAFISALSLNETYPDVSICQQAKVDLMRSISNWRQGSLDITREMLDRIRTYRNLLNDSLTQRVLNNIVNAKPDALEGIGIPSNFIGFPTDQLYVDIRDQQTCVIYNQDHAGDPMYVATWNRALGTCHLARKAALEFMERPFLSTEVSNRIDLGQDAGAFDSVVPPTAVPQ